MRKPEPAVVSFETYREPALYERNRLEQIVPSCFNGVVSVRKWRVTFEPIDEPNDVIAARLQALWEQSDNHHHWSPLRAAAKSVGYELKGNPGAARKVSR